MKLHATHAGRFVAVAIHGDHKLYQTNNANDDHAFVIEKVSATSAKLRVAATGKYVTCDRNFCWE